MYFKRLEMHGFKSFAEPVVIEFHEGVTCIVGPNGSGKSNISDAIRWVLGEQSPKMLRGGKMEEVIFAGTASRKSRGMAEVTLVIDNSMGILDIDYNEVAITRRMFRSGESEYLINNNQCRLRDIRELIMDTGIGVDGYSIIGQGKIADIVSNKPESRREIFEEAAGVVLYKSKKNEAERKFAATNNNLERVNDIVGEIEGRIDGLREDSIKAKEYLTLKEKFKDLEINITLKNIDNINGKNTTFKDDISRLSESIKGVAESKSNIDTEIEKARCEIDALDKIGNEARDNLLQTVEEINKYTNESQLNEERLSGIEKDKARIVAEIQDFESKILKEDGNKEELEKAKTEILEKQDKAKKCLDNKIIEFNLSTEKKANLAEKIDEGKNNLFSIQNNISAKKSEAKSMESLIETMSKRKAQILDEAAKTKESGADNEALLNKTQTEKDNASERSNFLMDALEKNHKNSRVLVDEQRKINVRIQEKKIKGSQSTSRKKTIEEMENNYEGYNYAVKYIMRAGITGIKGVVAELMKVPAGFEVAVETALGGAVQNIICDNDANAKKGVNALKENKAGRLTFLPMTSIKPNRYSVNSQITNDKGYKGLAVDCIKYEDQYKNIFEYLLGRVAVVDNMDSAIRLSKASGNGIRFVTLDGEIINASGAITGGKFKNKTANLLERKSEIDQLENEINKIGAEILELTSKDREITEKINNLTNSIKSDESEKRETDIKIASLVSKISALEGSIQEKNISDNKFNDELAAIEKETVDAKKMVKVLMDESLQYENEIVKINDDMENLMKDYEKYKLNVDQQSEDITKTRIEKNEWESKEENLAILLDRVKGTIEDYRFQQEERQNNLKALDEEKNHILFGTDDKEQSLSDMISEKKNLEEYIEKVLAEKEDISRHINEISKEQQSVGTNLNSYQDEKYQLEIKLAKNETQLETLKERLWDEFEISYAQAVDFKHEDFVMSSSVKESREIKNRIRELGEVNVGAIKEYDSVSERYKFLTEQRSDILTAMEQLKNIIDDMDATIKSKFKENFDQVVVNFEGIFQELFGGGHAELRMEDENNPLESGIDIIAQPPGKKLQNINLMSGGEKTMTAIALMFAVLKTKPTPFCILDEVEAALDDANIDRFAAYLRKFNSIQFALVTHQKATMEHADVLYGVTMPEQGISKVLSLRLGDNFDL